RIDEHEVGEAEPGVRIVDELGLARIEPGLVRIALALGLIRIALGRVRIALGLVGIALGRIKMMNISSEFEPPRPNKTEVEKGGGRAGTAVESEGQRARASAFLGNVRGVEDRSDLVPGLAVK